MHHTSFHFFLRYLYSPFAWLLLLTFLCLYSSAQADEKVPPNIVLILSDDQAWKDYGFMGNDRVNTPHLDKLAGRSIVFERGYVASPLCRPSLASMLTGLYSFQHGVTGNDVDGSRNRAALDVPLREGFYKHPNFVKLLTSNGYLAHQSGKFWEGSFSDGGFTHGMTHGEPSRGGRHGDVGLNIGRQGLEPVTTFIDMAVDKKKPFFLWYAPFLPHTPHNPPKDILEKYEGRCANIRQAKYYAMCEWFDQTCGDLLEHIDERGLSENTVVLYICDNGWAAYPGVEKGEKPPRWTRYALRSKGSPYEEGIRTPILVSWPGKLQPERSKAFALSIDLFPTIASAVGLDVPKNLPGINLMDKDQAAQRDRVFGECHSIHNITIGKPGDTLQYLWCIDGKWKLLERYAGLDTTKYVDVHSWDQVPLQLFDLSNDPNELENLADEHPDVVKRLQGYIKEWHPLKDVRRFQAVNVQ